MAVPGVSRRRLQLFRETFGQPELALQQSVSERERWLPGELAARLERVIDIPAAERLRQRVHALGARIRTLDDPEFPEGLRHIPDPPLLIFVRGEIPVAPAVALVGARKATLRGRRFAESLAHTAARAGLAVVSGLAYGIDLAAHSGALAAAEHGASTAGIAVWASGFDRPAPRGNQDIARRILAQRGAWISEYAPGQGARAFQFPERNRLVSGLAAATVVVEAEPASGSLWTARHALEQGRELLSVPGPVDLAVCRGSNALLRDGAAPVIEESDLLAVYGLDQPEGRSSEPPPGLGQDARRIFDALASGPEQPDALMRRLALEAARFSAAVVELELAGWVVRSGGELALRRS